MVLLSRAHGFDLYEERFNPPYIPLREETLSEVDRVFAISHHGESYLSERYPRHSNKFEVSRLGVHDPNQHNAPSQDGKFRILSCSTINKVKRLELLVYGLDELVSSYPHLNIVWTHLGTGPLFSKTRKLAEKTLGDKVQFSFLGDIPNDEAHRYYRENPVDLFVNVSRYEGVPVSVMEALSYGVSVMATAVGGIPEIVSEANGKLLDKNPSPEQIAEGINSFITNPEHARQKGGESKKMWENEFNAATNYPLFIKSLESFTGSRSK
jgi:glycosyltransferase involved in cell wall biosynthesis